MADAIPARRERTLIETHRVTKDVGSGVRQTILHPVSIRVRQGDSIALTGASGSGKSTLLYLLGLLDQPTTGSIGIDGVDTSEMTDDERSRLRREQLGFVFQSHFLLPEFTVLEGVELPLLRRGAAPHQARRQALATLDRLDIGELRERRPHQLSGGQQQRAAIARAVAGMPKVLLADEPTGNLDSKSGDIVMNQFERLNREDGIALVVVTHDPKFAARMATRVEIKDGRIVEGTL